MVFSETGKGNVSKNNKPSNDVAEKCQKLLLKVLNLEPKMLIL